MLSYEILLTQHLQILKQLQYKSGLFAASRKDVGTGYDKSWLRDNFYECLAFMVLNDWQIVERTYDAIMKIFLKHEEKIDAAISKKPDNKNSYIHARFNPETFDEYWEDWGNKQNDSIGAILFMVGELEQHKYKSILESEDHIRILNKLVRYLESIEYWNDKDSGMWEENEELHSSSVGAVVAGLRSIARCKSIHVPEELINKGQVTLNTLIPRESEKKFVDLALLSLIYPYNVLNPEQRLTVLSNIEYHLLRKHGVIRYKNDYYYNKNPDGYSEEAEWTFGLSWLAIIYEHLGQKDKARELVEQEIKLDTEKGIPELYFSNSSAYNENTPLGWSESLFIVALHEMNSKNYGLT